VKSNPKQINCTKVCGLQESHNEKKCVIKGGSQEMAVMPKFQFWCQILVKHRKGNTNLSIDTILITQDWKLHLVHRHSSEVINLKVVSCISYVAILVAML